jgi:hypothetical protein
VPVATGSGSGIASPAGALGNRITQVVVPFPVYLGDPVERLHAISEAMRDVKDSKLAAGAEMIAGMQDFAPPTLLAQASRMNFSGRFFKILPFKYSVTLRVIEDGGDGVILAGSSWLGRMFGTFCYRAEADACRFEARYTSKKDNGVFRLERAN